MKRPAILAAAWTLSGFAFSAAAGPVTSEFVLPPGLEQRVLGLIEPHAGGSPLPGGWTLGDTEIRQESVRYRFHLGDRRFELELYRPGPATSVASRHFGLRLLDPGGQLRARQADELLDYLGRVIAGRDVGPDPWVKLKSHAARAESTVDASGQVGRVGASPEILWMPTSGGGSTGLQGRRGFNPTWLIQVGLVAGLVLLSFRARFLLGLARRIFASCWVLLTLLTGAGAALRAIGCPRVPGWINSHGYELLRDVLVVPPPEPDAHGQAFHALHGFLFSVLPAAESTVVAVQFVLSCLSIFLTYLVGRLWLRERSWALWAAAAAAVLPVNVFYAATEVHLVPGVFFLLLTLVAAGVAVRDRHPATLIATALLAAVTTQCYPVFMLLPAGLMLFVGTLDRGRELLRQKWAWVAMAVFLCAWIVPAVWLVWLLGTGAGVVGPDFLEVFKKAHHLLLPSFSFDGEMQVNVFLNYHFTPPVISALGGIGLVAGIRRPARRRAVLAVLAGALLLTLPGLMNGRMNPARLQLGAQPFYSLLAGAGLGAFSGWVGRSAARLRYLPPLAGVALLGLSVAVWPGPIGKRFTPQLERRLFEAGIGRLPDGCAVIWPPNNRGRINLLPFYLSIEAGRRIKWGGLTTTEVPGSLLGHPCLIYYRPATCHDLSREKVERLSPAGPGGGLSSVCLELERQLELERVFVNTVPALPDSREQFGRSELEIGFFRVTAIRPGSRPGGGP